MRTETFSARRPFAFATLLLLVSCSNDAGVKVYTSPPRVTLTAPADGSEFQTEEAITFEAQVEDDRDANEDLALVWTSDRDGALNTDPADADGYATFTTAALTAGTHVITLQVTNAEALSAEDFVTITVVEAEQAPSISIRAPNATASYGVEGVAFSFEALVADLQDAPGDLTVWFASDVDGTFCEPVPDGDGYAACEATLSPGTHALTMGVVDTDGNETTAEASFDVYAASAYDDDRDGYTEEDGDCDDGDSSVRPGATEYANGADDDCDGTVDEGTTAADDDGDGYTEDAGDCDDGDPDSFPGGLEVCDGRDNDCDLAIDDGTTCVDDDGDGLTDAEGDCDDTVASTYPGASELPDTVDNDCDGTADEGSSAYDDDGDCACETEPCTASIDPACTAPIGGDCDDADDTIAPDADEICNSVDDDCDGTADEDAIDAVTWYADADGDLYGDAASSILDCDAPVGYTSVGTDCDDTDATISPVASESCDGEDDDCDGSVDESSAIDASTWYRDADSDGYGLSTSSTPGCTQPAGYVADATDCNDGASAVNPAATEVCDSIDNDCDGTLDESDAADATTWWADSDGDGYGGSTTSVVSCSRPGTYSAVSTDCDDANAAVSPAGTESCDSLDNDCDGSTDEGVTSTWYRDADGDGYGDAATTTSACSAPSGYVANDDDCNDSSASSTPGSTWYRDADGDGYGDATATTTACTAPSGYVSNDDDCSDSTADASPAETETCDGIDNDCDGYTDERNASGCTDYYVDADSDGYGATGTTSRCYCEATGTYSATNDDDCYDSSANANPAATAYYTTSRGDGSYDYNCDGSQTRRYTTGYECTGAIYVCVDSTSGWTGSTPNCGNTSTWGTGCSASLTSCSYSSSSSRTQSCR